MCIVKPVAYVCIHIYIHYVWYVVPNFAGHPQFAEVEDSYEFHINLL